MAYLVGTDEAGYGPNLGPLVVSATVWRVDSIHDKDMFGRLKGCVQTVGEAKKQSRRLRQSDAQESLDVVIGDSKDLYKRGKGLSGLEQGVFTCLAGVQKKPRTWQAMFKAVAKQDFDDLAELPWYRDFDDKLPVDLTEADVTARADRLVSTCEETDCSPVNIASRVVFPGRFNEMCERYGNKASALSQTTLQLVRSVLDPLPADEPVYILCDKHGGRNKYGPLLNDVFPETLAVVRQEGREESEYQLGHGDGRRELVFRAKGDVDYLPAALASMVSKYLRELAMRAFNAFWIAHVTGLKPTAGYPVDAKRFKKAIEPMQSKLQIDDRILWRSR